MSKVFMPTQTYALVRADGSDLLRAKRITWRRKNSLLFDTCCWIIAVAANPADEIIR